MNFFRRPKIIKPSEPELLAYYSGIRAAIEAAKSTGVYHQTHLESITLRDTVEEMSKLLAAKPKCRRCAHPLGTEHESFYVDKGYDGVYTYPCGYGKVLLKEC